VIGSYNFNATYSGDGNYTSAVNTGPEPLTVNPAIPTIVTALNVTRPITLGAAVKDTATVTGLGDGFPTPTGTVTFWVTLPNGTTEQLDTESLVGTTATSNAFVPLVAGSFHFNATYSGDGNYTSSVNTGSEPLTVNPAPSTIVTALNTTGPITLGSAVKDTATVTGLGDGFPTPTGTVTFYVTLPNGTVQKLDTESLSSGMAVSNAFVPLVAGSFSFNATYSGDGNYTSAVNTGPEPLCVYPAPSTIVTALNVTGSITLGAAVKDTATVTGLGGSFPVPTGTVTFWVTLPNGTTEQLDTESLVGTTATSNAFVPLVIGSYNFNATYSGDGNYTSAVNTGSEPLTVKYTPIICTCINGTCLINANIGCSLMDQVTVAGQGGIIPTGTVEYWIHCQNGSWINYDNETLNANGVNQSVFITISSAGSYYFQVYYLGDSNFVPLWSPQEAFTINPPPTPTIVTALNVSSPICLGTPFMDTATISGYVTGFNFTGAINFYWSNNSGTTWYWLSSASAPATGGIVDSIGVTNLGAGTYYFMANYTGDSYYNSAASNATAEKLIIYPATTTIVTNLNASCPPGVCTEPYGTSVYDNATLSGYVPGFLMTGTINFYYRIGTGPWILFSTVSAPTTGGTVSSSVLPNLGTGTYYFMANYTCSTFNYSSAASNATAEELIIQAPCYG
jgi:hypothetical protein